MAIDPKDLGALEKALNDAAGKASVLWTTFVTFELYLAIAFGSVKHRDLFLETPVKLPILNVDLPLVGFFVLAPAILVIFHFYVFLQLYALATRHASTMICSRSRFRPKATANACGSGSMRSSCCNSWLARRSNEATFKASRYD